MPKSSTAANDFLNLLFRAVSFENIADNAAVSPATNLVVALHSADPEPGGNQTTHEIVYTSYARVNVARPAGWNVAAAAASPVAPIDFPTSTGGADTIATHFSIGTSPSTTANKILVYGTIVPAISITLGVAPRLTTGTTITET